MTISLWQPIIQHCFRPSFALGFIFDIFFGSSFSFFLFLPSLLCSFFFPSDVDSDPSCFFLPFRFLFVFFYFSLDSFLSLVLCSPCLFLLFSSYVYHPFFHATGFSVEFLKGLHSLVISCEPLSSTDFLFGLDVFNVDYSSLSENC